MKYKYSTLCLLFITDFVIHKDNDYNCGFAAFKTNKELGKNSEAFWDAEVLIFPLNNGKMEAWKTWDFFSHI